MAISVLAKLKPYKDVAAALPPERLLKIDGRRIYVEDHGRGEAVILLHGFAASSYSFRDLIPILAQSRRVIAIDLNGFGWTERPDEPASFTPASQALQILDVLNRLEVGKATVAGHSYGGTVALHLAKCAPERVQRFVLISPATGSARIPLLLRSGIGRKLVYGMTRLLLSRPRRFRGFLGKAYYRETVLTGKIADAYRQRLLVEGLDRTFRGFGEALQGGIKVVNPATVSAPVTMIAGRHDAIVPLESLEDYASRFPDARLVTLEESGHSSPEEEPLEVAGAILGAP